MKQACRDLLQRADSPQYYKHDVSDGPGGTGPKSDPPVSGCFQKQPGPPCCSCSKRLVVEENTNAVKSPNIPVLFLTHQCLGRSVSSEGVVCSVSRSRPRLHFGKQAVPSATSTCSIYPQCTEPATTTQLISIQMSAAARRAEGRACSTDGAFVAARGRSLWCWGAGSETRFVVNEAVFSSWSWEEEESSSAEPSRVRLILSFKPEATL